MLFAEAERSDATRIRIQNNYNKHFFDEKFKELSEVVLTYLTANTMTAEGKTIMSYHCNYFVFRRCQN